MNATISDQGIGTIWDGGPIPPDCDFSRIDYDTHSLTCTNRPAGQWWLHRQQCLVEWLEFTNRDGNIVTGNGTSTSTCDLYMYNSSSFVIVQ